MTPRQSIAQPRAFPADSAVRAILQARVDAGLTAGYAVALVDRTGTRIVTVGTGARGAPIDARSVFEIGSITKTMTGAVLASLVVDGTVRLDQPVSTLLPPGTEIPARNGRAITLADLATQSSGLPRLPSNLEPRDPANPYADYDGARLLAFLAGHSLTRDPGARYEYSNLGLGLLGYALATTTTLSYEALVTRRLLAPLGMTETVMTLTPALRARVAPGHDEGGAPVPLWDFDAMAGAGALRSTISDMARYLEANLAADLDTADPRTGGLGPVLAMAHAQQRAGGPSGMTLGLAWHRLRGPAGDTIVWHNGGTGGYASFLGYSAARQMGVVILTNGAATPDEIALHWLLGTPLPPITLPHAMTRATITLDTATLARYVGRYELTPDFSLVIARQGAGLTVTATGQSPFALYAESRTRFFLRVIDADLEFELDAAGVPTAVTLIQNGARQRAVRR